MRAMRDEQAGQEPTPGTPRRYEPDGFTFAKFLRVGSGIGVGLVLLGLFAETRYWVDTISSPPYDASAIQVIAVYAERIFYAICAIGLGVSAYILSRYAN